MREGRISATSINATIKRLAQILDVALEHYPGLLSGNAAGGRRRRLKAAAPRRTFLELDQVVALLDGAGELDARAESDPRPVGRRAMLATLALTGLRIGELTALRWRDVDLAAGRISVAEAKTSAGVRRVDIGALLRDELATHRARARFTEPDDFVFATARRGRPNPSNLRTRVLLPAVELANVRLAQRELVPIPEGITFHSLRRTYISLLLEAGENPRVVMEQVGRADPGVTLRIYAQVMNRRDHDGGRRVDALIKGVGWPVLEGSPEDVPSE